MSELLKYYELTQRLKTAKGRFTKQDLTRAIKNQERKCRRLGLI